MLKIDIREKDDDLIASIMDKVGDANEVEFTTLAVGDYLWNERVCIEAKSVKDFDASMRSGHLDTQILDMQQYPSSFLVVHGNLMEFVRGGKHPVTPSQRLAKLTSIQCRSNTRAFVVPHQAHAAQVIVDIPRFCDEGERVVAVMRHTGTFGRTSPSAQMYCAMPRISATKAEGLLSHCPSFYDFITRYKGGETFPKRLVDAGTRRFLDAL